MRKKQKNVTEEQNTKSMRKDDVAVNKKDETTDGYKSELNTIFKSTRIAVIIITTITIVSIIIITFIKSNNSVEKYEADLMASGLAIIGIAISVWAGLNIANAIEKKEVEDIKGLLEKLSKEISNKSNEINNTKKSIEMAENRVKTINSQVDLLRNEKQLLNYNVFLQELLSTGYDMMSKYFYNKFSEDNIDWKELSGMVLMEQIFSQVYKVYGEASKDKSILIEKSNQGIKIAEDLAEKLSKASNLNQKELIKNYLQYRIADFYFMKGYMVETNQSYKQFEYAAKEYEELYKLFDINIVGVGSILNKYEKVRNPELVRYFANTIGESYSKITHNPPDNDTQENNILYFDECSDKAIFYLDIAAKLNEELSEKEVYYRNLGCAYERRDEYHNEVGKNAEKIIDYYTKALKAIISYEEDKRRVQKVYHTLLSYYEVYLEKKLNYEIKYDNENNSNITELKITHAFASNEEFKAYIYNLRGKWSKEKALRENIITHLYNFNYVSKMAVIDNPRFSLNMLMKGFSLGWIIVLWIIDKNMIENNFDAGIEKYLNEMHECVTALKIIKVKDCDENLEELKKRYEILSAYCKEH